MLQAKKILQKHRIEKLLVVNKKGKLSGLITVKDILKNDIKVIDFVRYKVGEGV